MQKVNLLSMLFWFLLGGIIFVAYPDRVSVEYLNKFKTEMVTEQPASATSADARP